MTIVIPIERRDPDPTAIWHGVIRVPQNVNERICYIDRTTPQATVTAITRFYTNSLRPCLLHCHHCELHERVHANDLLVSESADTGRYCRNLPERNERGRIGQ